MGDTAITVYFGLMLVQESFPMLRNIDTVVYDKRKEKKEFHRSENRNSSFYPKVHILSSRDVRKDIWDDIVIQWKKYASSISQVEFSLPISGLLRVGEGLLLLKLQSNDQIERIRKKIVSFIQPFRTMSVKKGKGGDAHWDSFPHISLATEITSEDMNNIQAKFDTDNYTNMNLKFDQLVMYKKDVSWEEEGRLKYY